MKKFTSFLLVFALVLSLTACGNTGKTETETETITAENTTEADTLSESSQDMQVSYPITLVDQLDRNVTIEKEPQTIVSAYYISTSLLLALGQQDKLVGVEAKADTRSIYQLGAPSIIELPNVGTAKEFDLETCASLNPDLVVLPAKLKDVIPALEELGLTVLAVNPEDQELLEEAIGLLSTAVNQVEHATELLTFTKDSLTQLEADLRGTKKPSVYLAGNSSFLSTATPGMYQHTLIENAGGTNAAEELTDSYWAEVSYEQLLAWNPDYIILAADAQYTVESVLEDPTLAGCAAVKNGHVYQFPNTIEAWDSPVPGSVLGSLWLASVLHPKKYPADQWEAAVVKFYETFYRFTPLME